MDFIYNNLFDIDNDYKNITIELEQRNKLKRSYAKTTIAWLFDVSTKETIETFDIEND